MRFAVLVFPGTWSDKDCQYVLEHGLNQQADLVWHTDSNLDGYDAVVLPGGFSYGDYLRTGAIARFSPVMDAVQATPSAASSSSASATASRSSASPTSCPARSSATTASSSAASPPGCASRTPTRMFSSAAKEGDVLMVPVSHGEGNYYADPQTIATLEDARRVVFRYVTPNGEQTREANPNGSLNNIAGIINERGNVLGMMPHPERSAEAVLGNTDGLKIFQSIVESALNTVA